MQIELLYHNDTKLERMDAISWYSQNSFTQKTGKKPLTNSAEYLSFLKAETGRDSLNIQDYEGILTPPEIADSILLIRENQRYNNVLNYLKSKNDSTTIKVVGYNPDEVLNIGSRPRFEVKYTLAEE